MEAHPAEGRRHSNGLISYLWSVWAVGGVSITLGPVAVGIMWLMVT